MVQRGIEPGLARPGDELLRRYLGVFNWWGFVEWRGGLCFLLCPFGFPLLKDGILLGPAFVPAFGIVDGNQRAAAVVVVPMPTVFLAGLNGRLDLPVLGLADGAVVVKELGQAVGMDRVGLSLGKSLCGTPSANG